ncbi:MAG: efflux transporter outer membrane subunit [Steroidobacteraceae bacterium]
MTTSTSRARSLTVATLLLTGCSLTPEYHRPPQPVADAYPKGAAYAQEDPSSMAAAGDIGWRDFLADPRLQLLVEVALRNNRDLRMAVLNVELLRTQFRIQSAALAPQIGAFADHERSRTPADLAPRAGGNASRLDSYSVGASVSWEIDLFGRLRSLKAGALEQYLASVQGRKATEILLVSQVADQYLAMLANDELLDVTQRTLETATVSYDLMKLQFDTGGASELDLRQAETIVELARANRAAQLRARAQAENGLTVLLGQPQPAVAAPITRLADQVILADIPADLPSALLSRRPDVLQAEALLRAANANIGAARAAFFPVLSLTSSGGTASAGLNDLFAAGSSAWTVQASVVETIFDAGIRSSGVQAARVNRAIGVAQYEKTIQNAFREVADGLAARGTFDEQIVSLERFTAAQRRRFELAQLLYRNGQASYLDVLTAQTALYDAEQVLVSARLQRLTNLVDLYRALGGGWLEHTGDQPRSGELP